MGSSLRGVIVWCADAFSVLSSTLWKEFVGCCDAVAAHFFFSFFRRNGFRCYALEDVIRYGSELGL
jgi:hypothetical protein